MSHGPAGQPRTLCGSPLQLLAGACASGFGLVLILNPGCPNPLRNRIGLQSAPMVRISLKISDHHLEDLPTQLAARLQRRWTAMQPLQPARRPLHAAAVAAVAACSTYRPWPYTIGLQPI